MSALENGFSMSTSWYALFSVFLMNVQLGQNYHQRDMVDHAAAVAADTVTKTLCADAKDFGGVPQGQYSGAREKAVKEATSPILDLVAPGDACKVSAKSAGGAGVGGGHDGNKQMDVSVNCEIPCSVPFAAQIMCEGGPGKSHVKFEAKQRATATGCDSGSSGSAGLGSGG